MPEKALEISLEPKQSETGHGIAFFFLHTHGLRDKVYLKGGWRRQTGFPCAG